MYLVLFYQLKKEISEHIFEPWFYMNCGLYLNRGFI